MLRRRGKGEASFLYCKSPKEGRARRHEQRKREKEGERGKERQKRGEDGKRRGEVETEVGQKKKWERGGQTQGKERREKQGNKRCWMGAEGGATLGISCSFNTWVISSKSFSNVGLSSAVLLNS